MNIDIRPEISTIRIWLNDDHGYDTCEPYDTILTIHHIGPTEVFIGGLNGLLSRKMLKQIFQALRNDGVTLCRFIRHGKMRELKI